MITRAIVIGACLLMTSCTTFFDNVASPGRIMRGNLDEGISSLEHVCRGMGENSCFVDNLEVIGHAAGSYRYYPMNIYKDQYAYGNQWSKKCKSQAKNIGELIDMFFKHDKVSSVEIDVQAPPKDHILCQEGRDCLFIMHDKPDWDEITSLDSPVVEYLDNNTLRKTLEHFVSEKHYIDKKLYVEIKSQFKCNAPKRNDEKCKYLGERVASVIKDFIKGHSEAMSGNNWITIVSFSATALESFRGELSNELKDKVDYALIAGVHPFGLKWFLGQLKGSVPLFNKELQKFAITTRWLDRVWFSAQGISDYNVLFKSLNEQRVAQCCACKPLEFSVASYPYKSEEFYNTMTRTIPAFDQSIASIMIDVDDVAMCR